MIRSGHSGQWSTLALNFVAVLEQHIVRARKYGRNPWESHMSNDVKRSEMLLKVVRDI